MGDVLRKMCELLCLGCKGWWRRFWRHRILPLTFPFFGVGDSNLAPQLAVLCGREIPGPIRSTGEYMFIRLTSDFSITGAGFNASFHKSNMLVFVCVMSCHLTSSSLSLSLSLTYSAYFSRGSLPSLWMAILCQPLSLIQKTVAEWYIRIPCLQVSGWDIFPSPRPKKGGVFW